MKERSGLKRTGSKIVFGLISTVILLWTAYLTTSFLSMVLPASFWIVPYLGLVVFDGGMIGWLTVYLYMAEGAMQRAIALGLTLFNLLGVGLMTIAEIVLGGQTFTAAPEMLGTVAIWGVGIWTFVNVAGIVAFHLSSPDARIAAAIQDEKDAIVEDALTDLRNRRGENAAVLGAYMGGGMFKTLVSEIGADADLVRFAPDEEFTVDVARLHHRKDLTSVPMTEVPPLMPQAQGTMTPSWRDRRATPSGSIRPMARPNTRTMSAAITIRHGKAIVIRPRRTGASW